MSKIFLFFFGSPGSGKGTQVDLLSEFSGLPVISPGELLRHEEDAHTALGNMVKPLVDQGKMVPDEIVEKIIEKRLSKKDAKNGVLFDGFPRNIDQLHFILSKIKNITARKPKLAAIHIKVSDQEVQRRISGRRVCDCGASYHILYNPPKKTGICDIC